MLPFGVLAAEGQTVPLWLCPLAAVAAADFETAVVVAGVGGTLVAAVVAAVVAISVINTFTLYYVPQ